MKNKGQNVTVDRLFISLKQEKDLQKYKISVIGILNRVWNEIP